MFIKIDFAEVTLDYSVIFEHDNIVFAHGRQQGSGPPRTFRIYDGGQGRVFIRNRDGAWIRLEPEDAETVRNRLRAYQQDHIPDRVTCLCGCGKASHNN